MSTISRVWICWGGKFIIFDERNIFLGTVDKFTVDKFTHYSRPTQSIMYVPIQVNEFQNSFLVIVQYKYLKSCSGDFYSPESDPPHKIMRYWFYYSI